MFSWKYVWNRFLQYIKKRLFIHFRKLETKHHELNYLFWECTARCNLNCLHCGSDCTRDSVHKDMPLNDFLAALDTITSKPKDFIVVITGGEPLLRADLELCGREIRKRGMRWSLVTNGYLYNAQRHNTLLNAGLGALTISLDGLKESHSWLRNTSKDFSLVERAIELASGSKRLNFDVVTCVNQRNINELSAIYAFLKEKNVKSWRLFTIVPIGRASDNSELKLNPAQFRFLMDFIVERRKSKEMDVKFSCEGYVGHYELKVRDSFYFCRAGINIASVLIDGSVSACPNIDRSMVQGNIYNNNFYEIWNSKFIDFRIRKWTKTGKCHNCSEYNFCMGNGMHNRRKNISDALVCHYEELLNA